MKKSKTKLPAGFEVIVGGYIDRIRKIPGIDKGILEYRRQIERWCTDGGKESMAMALLYCIHLGHLYGVSEERWYSRTGKRLYSDIKWALTYLVHN